MEPVCNVDDETDDDDDDVDDDDVDDSVAAVDVVELKS